MEVQVLRCWKWSKLGVRLIAFAAFLVVPTTNRVTLASCSGSGQSGQCEYCTTVVCDGVIVRESCISISACGSSSLS